MGKKEAFGPFPKAGIPEDIKHSTLRFSAPIARWLLKNSDSSSLQEELLKEGAVIVNPNLILLELRASKMFKAWAKVIRKVGPAGDKKRQLLLTLFRTTLLIGLFLISPIISALSAFIFKVRPKKFQELARPYQGIKFECKKSVNR